MVAEGLTEESQLKVPSLYHLLFSITEKSFLPFLSIFYPSKYGSVRATAISFISSGTRNWALNQRLWMKHWERVNGDNTMQNKNGLNDSMGTIKENSTKHKIFTKKTTLCSSCIGRRGIKYLLVLPIFRNHLAKSHLAWLLGQWPPSPVLRGCPPSARPSQWNLHLTHKGS